MSLINQCPFCKSEEKDHYYIKDYHEGPDFVVGEGAHRIYMLFACRDCGRIFPIFKDWSDKLLFLDKD